MFNYFYPLENRAVYEIMSKNSVESGRPHMTIWRMRTERWTPTVTNTHPEYVVLIAFPLQQWLHESVSLLRSTCTACPVLRLKYLGAKITNDNNVCKVT
jgi:hypothetical protein